jgi:hypothetical protein
MRLILVFAVVLTELSVGSLLMTGLLPPREIRLSFFTFNSLLSAIAAGLALVLLKFGEGSAWGDVRFLGWTVIGATVAFGAFKLEKVALGRMALIVSGLLGLAFGLLPLSGRLLQARGWETTAPLFFGASMVAGAGLFGATHVGMVLGHWYLIMRRLSFEYLELFAKILLGAAGVRALVVLTTFVALRMFDPKLAGMFLPPLLSIHANAPFFLLRLLFGIVGPVVLGFMVLRCARAKANQAATGLLYVAEISVLFGELFAAFLLV